MTEAEVASQGYVFLTQDEKYKHARHLFKCLQWQNSIKSGGDSHDTWFKSTNISDTTPSP